MFDMLGKGFKSSKCKTLLKLAMARIKLLRNKRDIQVKQMRKDLAQLLQTKQEASARIRVEHIIREQNIMAAYDIVELFCELVAVRLPIIEGQKSCPIDLKEAISSLIFASPRCADLPELLQVRSLFAAKYGKEFAAAAAELRPDSGVNRRIIEKLSVRAPPGELKLKLMKEIAAEHNVDWDPADTENELLRAPEDLLDGPSHFVGASQIPLSTKVKDELPSAPSKLPENSSARQFTSGPSPSVPSDTSEANLFPDVPQGKVPPRSKYGSPPKSFSRAKQVVVEESDEGSSEGESEGEYVKHPKGKTGRSRSRKDDHEAYKHIAAAARAVEEAAERTERASREAVDRVERAAREAAERATAAARAATELAKSGGPRPAFSDFIRRETRSFDDYQPPPEQPKARSGKSAYSKHQHSENVDDEQREEKYGSPENPPDQDERRPRRGKSRGLNVISEEKKKRQEVTSRRSAQSSSSEEEGTDPRAKYGRLPADVPSSKPPMQRDAQSPTGSELDADLNARLAKLSGRDKQPSGERGQHSSVRSTQEFREQEDRLSEDERAPSSRRASDSGRGVQPSRERSFASEHPQAEEETVPVYDMDFNPHLVARGSGMRDQRSPPEKQEMDDIFNTADPSSPLERSLRGKPSTSGVVRYDSYNDRDESQHRNRSSKHLTKSNSSSSEGGMSNIDMFEISVREVQDHGWTTSRGPVSRDQSSNRQQLTPERGDVEVPAWSSRDLLARGSKPQPESRRSPYSGTSRGQARSGSEDVLDAPERSNYGEDLKPTVFAVPPPPGHPDRPRYNRSPSSAVSKSASSPRFDDAPPSVPAPVSVPPRISPTSHSSSTLSPPSKAYSPISGPPPPQRPPPPVEGSPSFKYASRSSRQTPSPRPPEPEPVEDSDSSDDSPREGSRRSPGLPDFDTIRNELAQNKK